MLDDVAHREIVDLHAKLEQVTRERDAMLHMTHPHPKTDHPALDQHHIRNARLYANRHYLIESLRPEIGHGKVAELGVAVGDFSKVMLHYLSPSQFVGFDIFTMHHSAGHWGMTIEELLKGMTHRKYFEYNLRDYAEVLVVEEGDSVENLTRYPDNYFDLIYVDARHDYEGVRADTEVSRRKVRPGGILIFNDYLMWAHGGGDHQPYGIVPVVNSLVVNEGYDVVAFALQQQMFCDIAIRKPH